MVKIRYQLQYFNSSCNEGKPAFYWGPIITKTFKDYKEALEFFSSYAGAYSFEIIEG